MSLTPKDIDNIDKWILTSTLRGLHGVQDLWNSSEDHVDSMLDRLEELEAHAQLVKENDIAMIIANDAFNKGVTTSLLYAYYEHKDRERQRKEEAAMIQEEQENELLNTIKTVHQFKPFAGPNINQLYWTFRADLGDGGVIDYVGRLVKVSWMKWRIWVEWKDAKGKKCKRWEHTRAGDNNVEQDGRYPTVWRRRGYPTPERLTFVWTERKITAQARKLSIIEKRKATLNAKKQRQLSAMQGL
jgi:hypothetical protein